MFFFYIRCARQIPKHFHFSSVAEPVHFWPAPARSIFFTGSGSFKKRRLSTIKIVLKQHSFFLTRILHLVAYIHRGHRRLSCTLQTEKSRPAILLTADSWPATSADLPHNVAHCRDIPPRPPPNPPTSPPHWSWDRKGGMKKKKMKKIVNVSVAYLPFLYAFFVWHGNKSGLVLFESGGRFL